nr:cation transporter [Rubripirellula obstinata]
MVAGSTGLVADSLDMLADASVYAISLYAVGRAARIRRGAATASGVLQLILGIGVLVEAGRRFVSGGEPVGLLMMGMGVVALTANSYCLRLIAKHKGGDVNFRASYIFSANDVIANIGVIISGLIVKLSGSQIPDLIIGILIAAVVVRGGVKILTDVRQET